MQLQGTCIRWQLTYYYADFNSYVYCTDIYMFSNETINSFQHSMVYIDMYVYVYTLTLGVVLGGIIELPLVKLKL